MIKNGRPYTNESGYIDDALITDLPEGTQKQIDSWIKANFKHSQRENKGHTSYGLKHILEDDLRIYLTNNQFKDAMMRAGFDPVDPNELNWTYRIKASSPALKFYITKMTKKWGSSWQYQRIMEILSDYWLSEPDEEWVHVKMYFRKNNGEEQTKSIIWRNPTSTGSLRDTGTYRTFRYGEYAWPEEERKEYEEWAKDHVLGESGIVDDEGNRVIL